MTSLPFQEAWHNTTTLHPLAICLTVVLAGALLTLPRRYAMVPLLLAACFISPAQRIVLLTMDFTMLRVLLLVACARIAFRGEMTRLTWRPLDTLFVLYCIMGLITHAIQFQSFPLFVQRLGQQYDAIGLYFVFRYMVRDWNDVIGLTTATVAISLPVTCFLLIESATGRNIFSIFGGVPEYTLVRQGRRRVQGAFGHPILLGCFWVAMLPFILALLRVRSWHRALVPIGLFTSVAAVVVTASSTPFLVLVVALGAMMLYPFRQGMPWLRWAATISVIGLQLAMVKPIWHLVARADVINGSTGWYRYKLIDEFIRRFDEWWLVGSHHYVHWYEYGFQAVTNQYVLEGLNGGLITLLLFIAVIVQAFRSIGQLLRQVHGDPLRSMFAWALGVSLTVHCVAFIGVTYTGQVRMLWYLALAMAATFQPAARHVPTVMRVRLARPVDENVGAPPAPVGAG